MIFKKYICLLPFLAYCSDKVRSPMLALLYVLQSFGVIGPTCLSSQGTWTQKADFGGTGRMLTIGFSIGTKGYIGGGLDINSFATDFWEWDQSTNIWSQKSSLPVAGRWYAVSFSIGNKGYFGTGEYGITNVLSDMWEYDPSSNTWMAKTGIGLARTHATGFSIGTKGYIGCGWDTFNELFDFWEFDPISNSWTQKATFIGAYGQYNLGFSVKFKGYFCSVDGTFWEWDQLTNTWTYMGIWQGTASQGETAFVIDNKAYIGTGWDGNYYYQDFWSWDQINNTWTPIANYMGGKIAGGIGFSIGNKGYVGTGMDTTGSFSNLKTDFWEFDPNGSGITENELENSITVCPNPFSENAVLRITSALGGTDYELKLYDVHGNKIKEGTIRNSSFVISRDGLPGGVYFLYISSGNKTAVKKLVIQ